MPSIARSLLPLGLLFGAVQAGGGQHVEIPVTQYVTTTSCVTVFETKTIPVTQYVDVVVPVTKTSTALAWTTKVKTVIEYHTVSVTNTVTNTNTAVVTITNTATATTTRTDTDTTTKTVPTTTSTTLTVPTTTSTTLTVATTTSTTLTVRTTTSTTLTVPTTTSTTLTVPTTTSTTLTVPTTTSTTITVPTTTSTTETIFTTTFDPCPKSCTVSAETVNVYFWPTDRPHTYPTTHVHPTHSYTFTYPSVYMFIPTAVATNTLGQPVGPATTSWMLPLRLHQVSTIVEGSNITRQLTLSDLRTDCPQTVDPTGIATLDWRCNPVLAAPNEVKSWAWPCNACGRFGLFDPPYAVPTLTGRLVEPTSILVPTITAAPIPTVPTTAAPTTPTVTLPTVVVPTVTTTPPPITAGAATFQINTAFVAAVPALVGMILL